MCTLVLIPSITITPAAEDSTTSPLTPTSPAAASPFPLAASVANFSAPSTRFSRSRSHSSAAVLPLPPLAAVHDDRISLTQRGMPVGSFKLNCVESIGALSPPCFNNHDITGHARSSVTPARAHGGVFGWTTAGGAAEILNNNSSLGPPSPRGQSRSRHTRAKSLNSLAEFGIPPPLASPLVSPPEASSRRSRYRSLGMDINMNLGETKFSIDLAVLDSSSPSEPGFQFSFPRRS